MTTQTAFIPFKGRPEPAYGRRCRVYRNLNAPGYFSVLADEGEHKGRVLGYARAVTLTNVTFKVQAGGYRRLQAEQVRNVHASAIGNFKACGNVPPDRLQKTGKRISYQPFRQPFFFDRTDPGTPVWDAHEICAYGADLLVPNLQESQ